MLTNWAFNFKRPQIQTSGPGEMGGGGGAGGSSAPPLLLLKNVNSY